jgi:hypothetical protein
VGIKTFTLKKKRDFFESYNGGPIYASFRIVSELKDGGVPVIGNAILEGVSRGKLEITCDGNEIVYKWADGPTTVAKDPLNDDWDDDESL